MLKGPKGDMRFGVILMIPGTIIVMFGIFNVVLALLSYSWPVAPGEILNSNIKQHDKTDGSQSGGATYSAEVKYEYKVEDQSYIGTRTRFGEVQYGDSSISDRIVKEYPVGRKTDIAYCPYKTSLAVLEPGLHLCTFFWPGFGVVFLGAGFALFWTARKKLKKQKKVELKS